MALNDKQERRLARQRGAGNRELKNATFGFNFGGSSQPSQPSQPVRRTPQPLPVQSSRRTPTTRSSRRTPTAASARESAQSKQNKSTPLIEKPNTGKLQRVTRSAERTSFVTPSVTGKRKRRSVALPLQPVAETGDDHDELEVVEEDVRASVRRGTGSAESRRTRSSQLRPHHTPNAQPVIEEDELEGNDEAYQVSSASRQLRSAGADRTSTASAIAKVIAQRRRSVLEPPEQFARPTPRNKAQDASEAQSVPSAGAAQVAVTPGMDKGMAAAQQRDQTRPRLDVTSTSTPSAAQLSAETSALVNELLDDTINEVANTAQEPAATAVNAHLQKKKRGRKPKAAKGQEPTHSSIGQVESDGLKDSYQQAKTKGKGRIVSSDPVWAVARVKPGRPSKKGKEKVNIAQDPEPEATVDEPSEMTRRFKTGRPSKEGKEPTLEAPQEDVEVPAPTGNKKTMRPAPALEVEEAEDENPRLAKRKKSMRTSARLLEESEQRGRSRIPRSPIYRPPLSAKSTNPIVSRKPSPKKAPKKPSKPIHRVPTPEDTEGAPKGKQTIPVTVYRLTRPQPSQYLQPEGNESDGEDHLMSTAPQPPRIPGVNPADVLNQVITELVSNHSERLLSNLRNAPVGNQAARTTLKRAASSIQQFERHLSDTFFALSTTLDANNELESRLRVVNRERLALRNELMELKKQREEVAIEIDAVRAGHARERDKYQRNQDINASLFDIELAVQRGRERGGELTIEERQSNLHALLEDVGGRVSGGGALVRRLRSLNGLMERRALTLEGRV